MGITCFGKMEEIELPFGLIDLKFELKSSTQCRGLEQYEHRENYICKNTDINLCKVIKVFK